MFRNILFSKLNKVVIFVIKIDKFDLVLFNKCYIQSN